MYCFDFVVINRSKV